MFPVQVRVCSNSCDFAHLCRYEFVPLRICAVVNLCPPFSDTFFLSFILTCDTESRICAVAKLCRCEFRTPKSMFLEDFGGDTNSQRHEFAATQIRQFASLWRLLRGELLNITSTDSRKWSAPNLEVGPVTFLNISGSVELGEIEPRFSGQ